MWLLRLLRLFGVFAALSSQPNDLVVISESMQKLSETYVGS